jgi:predicted nuclease with TOPRIM domain
VPLFTLPVGTWNEVRVLYLEQLRGLENLHEQVREGIEQLRSESKQLYRMDDAIQRQRTTLQGTFKDFEDRYTLFQEKSESPLL